MSRTKGRPPRKREALAEGLAELGGLEFLLTLDKPGVTLGEVVEKAAAITGVRISESLMSLYLRELYELHGQTRMEVTA